MSNRNDVWELAAQVCQEDIQAVRRGQVACHSLRVVIGKLRHALDENTKQAHSRRSDPDTSRQAARTVKVDGTRKRVWDILKEFSRFRLRDDVPFGVTDEQLIRACDHRNVGISPSGARSRRSELVKLGMVQSNGKTKGSTGRLVTVWTINPLWFFETKWMSALGDER